ncbi:MAG: zeta toxin family protein [Mucilaginibacter sp.]
MNRPILFIIAGPNGSGKSMFSAALTGIDNEVFDGDKHLARLKKSFPEIGSDVLLDQVNDELFVQAKITAMDNHEDFAFETNFVHDDPTFSMRQFSDAGYKTHLIFMGMNDIPECIQRVSFRVKAGGHKVPEETIVHNFKTGLRNLYKYYHEFDKVTLLDNSIASNSSMRIPVKLLTWEQGYLTREFTDIPAWAEKFIRIVSKKSSLS